MFSIKYFIRQKISLDPNTSETQLYDQDEANMAYPCSFMALRVSIPDHLFEAIMRSNLPPVGMRIAGKKKKYVEHKSSTEYLAELPLQNDSYCFLCNMTLSLPLGLGGYDECQGQSDRADMGHQGEVIVLSYAYL